MCKVGDEIPLLSSVARNKTLFYLGVFLTEFWLERPLFEELLEIEAQLLPGPECSQNHEETIDLTVERYMRMLGRHMMMLLDFAFVVTLTGVRSTSMTLSSMVFFTER